MKYLNYLLLICLTIIITGCPSDDDGITVTDLLEENEFSIGNTSYSIENGFRSNSMPDAPGLFVTNVVFTTTGLSLNTTTQELEGTGDLVAFEFYTSNNNGLQAGTYNLDSLNNQADTVYAYIGLDYNASTGVAATEDDVFQGTITVTEEANNVFTITGNGVVDNAQQSFVVTFEGNIQLVQ